MVSSVRSWSESRGCRGEGGSTLSQVYGPIDHVEEEEGEREESPGVQVDSFSSRGDDGFGRRRPLVVLGLGLANGGFDRLAVAVKVRQLKVPR